MTLFLHRPISYVSGYSVSSVYGWRGNHFHAGIDYGVPTGTEVLAAYPGTVVQASDDYSGYGISVILKHEGTPLGTIYTRYAHLSETRVNVGDRVEMGQLVALSGNTGYSTGAHLHFEVINDSLGHLFGRQENSWDPSKLISWPLPPDVKKNSGSTPPLA